MADSPAAAGGGRLSFGLVVLLAVIIAAAVGFAAAYFQTYSHFSIANTSRVPSRLDGLEYKVHEAHTDPGAAADLMARLSRRTTRLLRGLRRAYAAGPRRDTPAGVLVANLFRRYDPDQLVENSPHNVSGDTAFTINKGVTLAICLRRGRAGAAEAEFHSLDELTFVKIHELAHHAVDAYNHPPEFWEAFRFLLDEAAREGVLAPVDYARRPFVYCDEEPVSYNPYFDAEVRVVPGSRAAGGV